MAKTDEEKEINRLKGAITKNNAELTVWKSIIADMNKRVNASAEHHRELSTKLEIAKQAKEDKEKYDSHYAEWEVTDHVIVRYFMRVLGLDMEHICNAILTEDIKAQIRVLGDGLYDMQGEQFKDFKLVVKNKTAITLWNGKEKKK